MRENVDPVLAREQATVCKRATCVRLSRGCDCDDMTATNKPVEVTCAQRRLLRNAERGGHAFAYIGARARSGGAAFRCCLRLGELGLLTKRAPFELTEAGRALLRADGKP